MTPINLKLLKFIPTITIETKNTKTQNNKTYSPVASKKSCPSDRVPRTLAAFFVGIIKMSTKNLIIN